MNFINREANRSIQLDFMRGIAIILVFCRHPHAVTGDKGIMKDAFNVLYKFGWTGVDMFFVLSGFLVGGLLFREMKKYSSMNAGRFVIRRGFKIWPAYYFYLIYLLFFETFINPNATFSLTGGRLMSHFLHYQNYDNMAIRAHTWSLAVEEHFYLMLPLLLYILVKLNKKANPFEAIPKVAMFICVACLGLRFFAVYSYGLDYYRTLFPTHLRIDGLFFGVLLAYYFHLKPEVLDIVRKNRIISLLIAAGLLYPMTRFRVEKYLFVSTIGFTMTFFGYGLILLVAVFSSAEKGFTGWFFKSWLARAVAFIGFHSYSIYLWHLDFGAYHTLVLSPYLKIGFMPKWLEWTYFTIIYWFLAVFSGVFMGMVVERPMLRLRDRLFPGRLKQAEDLGAPSA